MGRVFKPKLSSEDSCTSQEWGLHSYTHHVQSLVGSGARAKCNNRFKGMVSGRLSVNYAPCGRRSEQPLVWLVHPCFSSCGWEGHFPGPWCTVDRYCQWESQTDWKRSALYGTLSSILSFLMPWAFHIDMSLPDCSLKLCSLAFTLLFPVPGIQTRERGFL